MGHRLQGVIEVGDHVAGQGGAGRFRQGLGVLAAGVGAVDAVFLRVEEADDLFQGGKGAEDGLNLAQLDAVAHVLNLAVPTGEKGEDAVFVFQR